MHRCSSLKRRSYSLLLIGMTATFQVGDVSSDIQQVFRQESVYLLRGACGEARGAFGNLVAALGSGRKFARAAVPTPGSSGNRVGTVGGGGARGACTAVGWDTERSGVAANKNDLRFPAAGAVRGSA